MCLHSQAKTNPNISLFEGIKHDLRTAIANAPRVEISEVDLDAQSVKMKKASWATLRKLINPQT